MATKIPSICKIKELESLELVEFQSRGTRIGIAVEKALNGYVKQEAVKNSPLQKLTKTKPQ